MARRLHRTTTALAAAALGLTLTACSAEQAEEAGAAASEAAEAGTDASVSAEDLQDAAEDAADDVADAVSEHTDVDTSFLQGMIAHHEGALDMSELAVDRAEAAEVKALAERITEAQGPEIEQMSGWLEEWGEDASGAMDMDMGGMSQEEMVTELEGLTGAEFDRAYLERMIEHHEGAIESARAQLDEGASQEAKDLAEQIIEDQEAEIEEMRELLEGL